MIKRPTQIVLDFDGTLTKKDTTALLPRVRDLPSPASAPAIQKPTRPWDDIVRAYMNDYNAHSQAYTPASADRSTLAEETAWLNSLRPIELASVKRVEDAGWFRGVTKDMMAALSSTSVRCNDALLREGCKEILSLATTRHNCHVSVLSVNWSRTWIRQVLNAGMTEPGASQAPSTRVDKLVIQANEIEGLDAREGSNGRLGSNGGGGIRTSGDKLRCLMTMRGCQESIVYVGDSVTDLECLIAADVGICFRDEDMGSGQRELASCFERIGVQVLPLPERLMTPPAGGRAIYWSNDLKAIARALETP